MKKADMLSAFDGIDPEVLWGKTKNKEITKLFLQGVPIKEIARKYGLSVSRIRQIVARQARGALFYKKQKNDLEYQALVEQYDEKMKNAEPIVIRSDWENKSKHLMAVSEARRRIKGDEVPMKSYIIKIELVDSDPLVWRRVIMPAGATFNRLHNVVQAVTNFQSGYPTGDYHLYAFDLQDLRVTNDEEAYQEHIHFKKNREAYEERLRTMPPEHAEFEKAYQEGLQTAIRKPTGLKIDDYLEKHKEILYNYDFGDDWHFFIKLEEIVDDYYFGYPTLLDGAETAPPEDVGGIPGFYDFLEAYREEEHPEHEEMMAWAGGQGFREYDPEWINEWLKSISYKNTQWDKINHDRYRIIEDKYREK